MSVSVATTPAYPVGGRDISVAFVVTGAGNYLKGYFTDAPIGSAVKTALTASGALRLPAFEVDAVKTWLFSSDRADLGGVYTLQIEQYTKGNAFGGGYDGAPEGYQTETLISSSTVSIQVGQKVTQKVGFGGDTATLTLFVVGSTVRASTDDTHGFTSPLIDDTKSKKALTASLTPSVLAAVAALEAQTTTTLLGDQSAVVTDLISRFYVHIQSTTYHDAADNDNAVVTAFLAPNSPEGLKRATAEFLRRLDQHMRNDNGGGTPVAPLPPGTGSAAYHLDYATSANASDWLNAVLGTSTGETLDTFVAIADAWRSFAGHLTRTSVHKNLVDGSNAPLALPPLLNVHRLFLTALAQSSPTAPASVNAGVTALVHGAGFEEA